MRGNQGIPGDRFDKRPPGIRRIIPFHIFRNQRIGHGMPGEEAIRENADISIKCRIEGDTQDVIKDIQLLAFGRFLHDYAQTIIHEMPVGHAAGLLQLHGLGDFVRDKTRNNYGGYYD